MKYFFILLTMIVFESANSPMPEDSIKITIDKLSTGMKNADIRLLKSSFADSVIFQTIIQGKEGNIMVKNEITTEFIDFVGKQSPGACDERISFETIKIDGPLAIAGLRIIFISMDSSVTAV